MGLTERHWFEDEEPELTENQLEDILLENNKIFERGYQKGFSDGKSALLREQQEERERIVRWLSKFCIHIDQYHDGIKCSDVERYVFFRNKMHQQFGW